MPSTDRPIIQSWLNKMKSSRLSIGGHWNRRYNSLYFSIYRRWVTIQNIGRGELALCYWNGPYYLSIYLFTLEMIQVIHLDGYL